MHYMRRAAVSTALAATLLVTAACSAGSGSSESASVTTEITQPSPLPTPEIAPSGWPEQELAGSTDPGLSSLAQYGDVLQQQTPDSLMLFTGMPGSIEEAETTALGMASTLAEYQRLGIKPLVIMEPTTRDGSEILDLGALGEGKYEAALNLYFNKLKENGVTDEMMGTWIVLPEANTPAWNITDPEVVCQAIVRTATAQKTVFPASEVGMLLDSQSYESYDPDWATGQFVSLLPYTQNIPKGLIDTFGLQGFPWVGEGASHDEIGALSPAQFLNMNLAIEAADSLGARTIWYNTGTFSTMHVGSQGEVHAAPADRQRIIEGIAEQVMLTRLRGYRTEINYFVADKSGTEEGVDWSYEQSPPDAQVLGDSVKRLRAAGVEVSLFVDAPS
jgi:hypothetical protein